MQYPRDLIGYGRHTPSNPWPDNARIAVQFVLNYEEGAENCLLHGDAESETFLSEIIGAKAYAARHMSMESLYEYGSRAGFWRLHRLFEKYNVPITVYGVAMALQRNPDVVAAMKEANWEIASHAYRWVDHQFMDEHTEREHIAKAIAIHKAVTGNAPVGWYTGRDSPNTRRLILEHDNFLYDSDSYADDLPYWHHYTKAHTAKQHLIIPYTLDNNDMRFAAAQGFNSGEQFFQYLKDSFDVLYAEGESAPKMMNIGLHCRIVGRPGRCASLEKFIAYVQEHENVWLCTREAIAKHWWKNFGPETQNG